MEFSHWPVTCRRVCFGFRCKNGRRKLGCGWRSSWFCADELGWTPTPTPIGNKEGGHIGLTVPETNPDFSFFLKYSSTYLAASGLGGSMRVLSSKSCIGSPVLVLGLSCPTARGILVSRPGINPFPDNGRWILNPWTPSEAPNSDFSVCVWWLPLLRSLA